MKNIPVNNEQTLGHQSKVWRFPTGKNKCRFFSQFFNIGFTNIPGLCIFVGFTNKYIHTALVHIISLFSHFAVRIYGAFSWQILAPSLSKLVLVFISLWLTKSEGIWWIENLSTRLLQGSFLPAQWFPRNNFVA